MPTKRTGGRAERRIVVSYLDGTWTDSLAVADYGMSYEAGELTLAIDVAPHGPRGHAPRAALRDFCARLGHIGTLQIGKADLAAQLRERMKVLDRPRIDVELRGGGRSFRYPAGVVFGPDEVTINLG